MIPFLRQALVGVERSIRKSSISKPPISICFPHLFFSTDKNNKRIRGIQVNPESVGHIILPGGEYCIKSDPETKIKRKVLVERQYGFFWMIKDLANVKNKTIISNKTVIPENEADVFPTLNDCCEMEKDESIILPNYFLRDNRANDSSAQCTLVAISFKDHGSKLVKSWTEPFEQFYGVGQKRAKVMRLFITEGNFTKFLLSSALKRSIRSSTNPELLSQTILRFGSTGILEFVDNLRMHNTLTGYVFLLDGLGRVRFAGSGEASENEVQNLLKIAKELTPKLRRSYSS